MSVLDQSAGRFTNYQYSPFDLSSLSHNSVKTFLKDKNGNVWVGTFSGGIDVYDPESKNFTTIKEQIGQKPGLSNSVISAMIYNQNGSLWVGTEGGGLNYVDLQKGMFRYYSLQEKGRIDETNLIKSMAQDMDGTLWIGTYNGLVHFTPSSGKAIPFNLPVEKEEQGKKREINGLLAGEDGIWVASNVSGLYYIDKQKQVTSYVHSGKDKSSLSSNNLTAIVGDGQNNLWIGSSRGLNYLNLKTQRFTRFANDPDNEFTISNNSVLSILRDGQHHLWIGTAGGLNYYNAATHRFYAITEAEGLPNNKIHAIQQAKDGSLWVSTNRGLSNISFKAFHPPFNNRDITITNYAIGDGLQSNQFSDRSSVQTPAGELFFGGISGISYFNPEKLIKNRVVPNVVYTDFEIKDKHVELSADESPLKKVINETKHITLTYDQAFISIKFAALNFTNPEKNLYAYKLEGLRNDNDWHYSLTQRRVSYTNLGEGNYIFKVRAANNDGVWNNVPRELMITVLPPPWKTWWAYCLYGIVILSLLYLFYYYSYATAKLKHDLDTEHRMHEKDEELAQRKLSFFTNISHEIKTPLTLILAPIEKLISIHNGNNKVLNQLMLMQRNGDRLIRLINQLLDFRKFESGNMKLNAAEGDLIKFIREVLVAFDAYATDRKIKLKFKPGAKQLDMWFDVDKLEKILYNLLSNALKFTHAEGEVCVTVKLTNYNEVIIGVRDNGIGISTEKQQRLFEPFNSGANGNLNAAGTGIGLAFSKSLVELHHGKITVESRVSTKELEGYSCFSVYLPLGDAHLSADELGSDDEHKETLEAYNNDVPLSGTVSYMNHLEGHAENEKPVLLIVEDNPEVQDYVADNFEEFFTIHKAGDGLAGWEAATTVIPDIIISDVMIPEINGIILCSKLKSDPRTSHIPVILLTARSPLIYKIEGLETGADDYITKPFSLRVLNARVYNLLKMRKQLRERYSKEVYLQPTNFAITPPDEIFLAKAMDFIEKNMENPNLSVEEMGKVVGISRITLYRKIKALTNLTPIEFIRDVRLQRAAQLLDQRKLNVNEVAYMVGFLDLNYFRRCFKEKFGHTPKDYLNQSKDKQ